MKKDQSRLIWGGMLILAGILFLLQELNILGNAFQYLLLILMAAGAAVFIWIYFTKKDQWWAIIPGLTLLGVSLSGLDSLLNFYPGSNWTGAIFLGCIGLAFWLIYLRRQDQWWAIIPGGVLITLAVVAGLENVLNWSGEIFFLGLTATFALVGILPNQLDTRWAFIPAAVLAVLGVSLSGLDSLLNFYPGSNWTGAIFLGCIGLAFWLIYLRRQDQWWAIIPGGVLITLAVVAGLENVLNWSGGIFFLGLAATFALVGILPNQLDTRWAFIPAAILAVLGVVSFAPLKSVMVVIWPVALIALGVYIIFRSLK